MNNPNTVINQQNMVQEENNQTPIFLRSFVFLGIRVPYWLCILCLIILIILIIIGIPEAAQYKEVSPNYDFTVTSESPGNTVVDNILRKNY